MQIPQQTVPPAAKTEMNPVGPPAPQHAQPPAAPRPQPPVAPAPVAQRPLDAGGEDKTVQVRIGSAPSSSVVAVLIGIRGPLEGEVFKLFDGKNLLGRPRRGGADAGLQKVALDSEFISREHAEVIHDEGWFGISSVDGKEVSVNDELIDENDELSDGDTISLGKTTLKFRTA